MDEKKPIPHQSRTPAKKQVDPSQVKKVVDPEKVKKLAPAQLSKQESDLYSLEETTEPQSLKKTAERKMVAKTIETKKLKKRTELEAKVRRPKRKVKSLDTTPKKPSKKDWGGLPSAREDAVMSILGGGALGLVLGLIHWFTGARIRLLRFYDLENPLLFPGESIIFLVALFALLGYLSTKTSRV